VSNAKQAAKEPLPEWKQALVRARDICGGWAAMTRGAEGTVDRNFFWRAFHEYTHPTAKLAIAVSRATAGQVRMEEVAPHLAAALRAERRRHPRRRKAA
jgi:hypothetical protein